MAHVHARGLVLRMDPDELRKQAATCSCAEDDAVYAQHYFLCIDSDASGGLWVLIIPTSRAAQSPSRKTLIALAHPFRSTP